MFWDVEILSNEYDLKLFISFVDLFILFKERVDEDEFTKDELTSIEKGIIFDKVSFSYDGIREIVKEIS